LKTNHPNLPKIDQTPVKGTNKHAKEVGKVLFCTQSEKTVEKVAQITI
jgi:hypothetical protein